MIGTDRSNTFVRDVQLAQSVGLDRVYTTLEREDFSGDSGSVIEFNDSQTAGNGRLDHRQTYVGQRSKADSMGNAIN